VFAAEEVLAKGRQWHRKCFKCHDCTKTLDSIIACDGPDSDVYCKTCYGKKWGPHGYGFACGSGFLQTDGLRLVYSYHSLDMSLIIVSTARKKSQGDVRSITRTLLPSRLLLVKDVHVAVVRSLLLNNNWPREL